MMWWELKNSWVPLTSFLSTRLTNWPVTPSFIAEASRTLFNRKYTPSLMTLHSSRATRKKTTAQNTSAQLSFSFLNILLCECIISGLKMTRPREDSKFSTRSISSVNLKVLEFVLLRGVWKGELKTIKFPSTHFLGSPLFLRTWFSDH